MVIACLLTGDFIACLCSSLPWKFFSIPFALVVWIHSSSYIILHEPEMPKKLLFWLLTADSCLQFNVLFVLLVLYLLL